MVWTRCEPSRSAVALLVSAWIEIVSQSDMLPQFWVALLVSAWIEMITIEVYAKKIDVALLVSAWIEMIVTTGRQPFSRSHSS